MDTLRARIAELKAEKATKEEFKLFFKEKGMTAMFFPYEHSQMLRRENSIGLLREYDTLTDEEFPAPLVENWPGGAPQFLAALRARIAELKAEKAAREEQEEK